MIAAILASDNAKDMEENILAATDTGSGEFQEELTKLSYYIWGEGSTDSQQESE